MDEINEMRQAADDFSAELFESDVWQSLDDMTKLALMGQLQRLFNLYEGFVDKILQKEGRKRELEAAIVGRTLDMVTSITSSYIVAGTPFTDSKSLVDKSMGITDLITNTVIDQLGESFESLGEEGQDEGAQDA